MLWRKGWLETRMHMAYLLGIFGLLFVGMRTQPPDQIVGNIAGAAAYAVMMSSILFAGAGIATQPGFRAARGLHGSTAFTVSLPVSRFRLLATRASAGWLGMAGFVAALCCEIWIAFPVLRSSLTGLEMAGYAAALIACGSGLYFVSVLLATFLSDPWRVSGCMVGFATLWWFSVRTPLPAELNIFRALVQGSPLIARSMPWAAMGFSIVLAACMFFVALKIVQTREY